MLQDELTTREQTIHHNKLIMQQEDWWQLQAIVLGSGLNLLSS